MTKTTISNQPLTKIDLDTALNKYPTKSDLKKTERILRAEILKVEEKVERVEEKLTGKIDGLEEKLTNKMGGIETKLDKISNQLDGFVGKVDDLTNDNEIGADQIHRLREDTKDLQTRVAKLESPAH